jgi:hypothetical protein
LVVTIATSISRGEAMLAKLDSRRSGEAGRPRMLSCSTNLIDVEQAFRIWNYSEWLNAGNVGSFWRRPFAAIKQSTTTLGALSHPNGISN